MSLFDKENPDRAAIQTTFMTPKGRLMFDAMIVKPRLAGQQDGKEIEYWIDIDADSDSKVLIKHLKKYAIRKNILVKDLSHIIKAF